MESRDHVYPINGEIGHCCNTFVGGDVDLVPVMTELPILTQGYRVVDSHGPRGIANQDFCFRKGLSLHPYINRIVSKMLVKRTLASAITVDDTPTRTIM